VLNAGKSNSFTATVRRDIESRVNPWATKVRWDLTPPRSFDVQFGLLTRQGTLRACRRPRGARDESQRAATPNSRGVRRKLSLGVFQRCRHNADTTTEFKPFVVATRSQYAKRQVDFRKGRCGLRVVTPLYAHFEDAHGSQSKLGHYPSRKRTIQTARRGRDRCHAPISDTHRSAA
jgi:hypothetical protein